MKKATIAAWWPIGPTSTVRTPQPRRTATSAARCPGVIAGGGRPVWIASIARDTGVAVGPNWAPAFCRYVRLVG